MIVSLIEVNIEEIMGPHPVVPHPCGISFTALDAKTMNNLPHRKLHHDPQMGNELIDAMTKWIVSHHMSTENIDRDRRRREALARQGLQDPTQRLPQNTSTQKGNWAEILLAEYVAASCNTQIPIYRLRYNTNVDQSMKGDDVLAFDLDSNPARVIVGEAKFRSTSTTQVVGELIDALEKSHLGNIPASLQFVADRLFDSGSEELGEKVAGCNILFAQNRLQLDYVGLLVSNGKAHDHVYSKAKSDAPRLAIMSLAFSDPGSIVATCFANAARML